MLTKTDYLRSPALMRLYRTLPCQHCGIDDGSVCGAHSNQSIHGKGRSIKAGDQYCASLCHACHLALDQGRSMSRAERTQMWDAAHAKTVAALQARGVWPQGQA